MPAGRVCVRHVREIIRLESAGVSKHQIARRTGVVPSTVRETLKRFAASGLSWPLGDEVTDAVLEARMYRNAGKKQGHRQYACGRRILESIGPAITDKPIFETQMLISAKI